MAGERENSASKPALASTSRSLWREFSSIAPWTTTGRWKRGGCFADRARSERPARTCLVFTRRTTALNCGAQRPDQRPWVGGGPRRAAAEPGLGGWCFLSLRPFRGLGIGRRARPPAPPRQHLFSGSRKVPSPQGTGQLPECPLLLVFAPHPGWSLPSSLVTPTHRHSCPNPRPVTLCPSELTGSLTHGPDHSRVRPVTKHSCLK